MNDIIKQKAKKQKGHKYTHPESGKVELISWKTGLWTLFFGWCYFAYKGVWKHACLSLAASGFTLGVSWLIYPFFACDILRNHYRKNGYKEGDIR